ncbi:MAG: hypothetical protein ACTS22_07610 [Phycisphaerales bacterium]
MALAWDEPVCDACGYSRVGLERRPCPECGFDPYALPRVCWARWRRLIRPVWLAAAPFVCVASSLVGEGLVGRELPAGLAASLLALAALYLLPMEAVLCWRAMHNEPLGWFLRLWDRGSCAVAVAAIGVCGLMVVAPM